MTLDSEPQVSVEVSGVRGLCSGGYCSYATTVHSPRVAAYTFDDNTAVLELTVHDGLLAELNDIKIEFGGQECGSIIHGHLDVISCNIGKSGPVSRAEAGSHIPIVIIDVGLAITDTLTPTGIDPIVTSVSPASVKFEFLSD